MFSSPPASLAVRKIMQNELSTAGFPSRWWVVTQATRSRARGLQPGRGGAHAQTAQDGVDVTRNIRTHREEKLPGRRAHCSLTEEDLLAVLQVVFLRPRRACEEIVRGGRACKRRETRDGASGSERGGGRKHDDTDWSFQ